MTLQLAILSDSKAFAVPLQIEAAIKVAKEKLLSQIEIYQDRYTSKNEEVYHASQTQDKKSSSHQRSDRDAEPAMVGVSEDKGLPLTSQPLPKQELQQLASFSNNISIIIMIQG